MPNSSRTEIKGRKNRIYTRREIEDLISRGITIIIVDQNVLKVDSWLKFHPGGDKAIMHMVGRDATDEVNALHSEYARLKMNSFQIGKIQGVWKNFVPPIQGGNFRALDDEENDKQPAVHSRGSSTDEQPSSTSESSRAPSPIFDSVQSSTSLSEAAVANRKPFRRRSSTTTASSVSSLGASPSLPAQQKTSIADQRTKEELDLDLAKYPPLDAASQGEIVLKYRILYQYMQEQGLFECNYRAYALECLRYATIFGLCLTFLHYGWYATSGAFLGMFWHQLVFTAHDAGHMGITHNFHVDTCIGILIADFLGGLSIGWWKRNHNVHHIVTNSPEHDPDIEHMPFFAISHRFFENLQSTYYDRVMAYDAFARFVIRYQHWLYYPILTFGRFNLYRLSWEYLLLGLGPRKGPAAWHRWLEIAGQVFFWTWFGYGIVYKSIPTMWGRFAFVLVSHAITGPLHVQITLSHFAMSTTDLGPDESFAQKMLRTTMDVDCPEWLDFLHGGLQFQAIHHLFPRMPRHNLRTAQKLVQKFCEETKIPYALYGFVDGNREVIGRLEDVGRHARILAECQRVVAGKPLEAH